jgi:hypothetical protein
MKASGCFASAIALSNLTRADHSKPSAHPVNRNQFPPSTPRLHPLIPPAIDKAKEAA